MRDTGAVVVALLALGAGGGRAEPTVTTDFEGGSAVVDAIDIERREVHVRPASDPASGWPCRWYLRIDGLAAGSAATVVVRGSERPARNNGQDTGRPLAAGWALPDRAAVSHDGTTWTQTEPGVREGERVSYPLTGTGGPVRGLRIAATGRERPPAVWIQARQHAWESGSSWVARGFVDWLLADEPSWPTRGPSSSATRRRWGSGPGWRPRSPSGTAARSAAPPAGPPPATRGASRPRGATTPAAAGIALMMSPDTFREAWWHNRDYGVFVANPFGRAALRQGPRSAVTVARGATLALACGVLVHNHRDVDMAAEFAVFDAVRSGAAHHSEGTGSQ